MAFHIVLVEPEIPPNTGNIARSCAATNSVLHLVKPLGFSIEDKALRRAGLDYWPYVDLKVHENLEDFLRDYGEHRMFPVTTKGLHYFSDMEYMDEDMFLFGKETAGLPKDLIERLRDYSIRIPMSDNTVLRSYNLANSANIILFEALRQVGYPGLK